MESSKQPFHYHLQRTRSALRAIFRTCYNYDFSISRQFLSEQKEAEEASLTRSYFTYALKAFD
jgi:hypothetical protein